MRKRTFEFNPVDPYGGWRSVTVGSLVSILSIAEALPVGWLPFLDAEFPLGMKTNFELCLDDLWLFDGSGHLVAADG